MTAGDRSMVRRIINRCHVSDSPLAVARYLISRTAPGAWWRLPRPAKRAFLACAFEAHRDNGALYTAVMRGQS